MTYKQYRNTTKIHKRSIAILDTLIVKNTHFPQFISRNWKSVGTPYINFEIYGVHLEFCDGHFPDREYDRKINPNQLQT